MSQLRGKVKIFLKEKGYGFIFGDDDQQYFFHASDVAGADLPQSGDTVAFERGGNSKGLKATQVHIKSKATKTPRRNHSDDRDVCASCGKKMIPRLIVSGGEVLRSVCPYCGKLHKDLYEPPVDLPFTPPKGFLEAYRERLRAGQDAMEGCLLTGVLVVAYGVGFLAIAGLVYRYIL